MDEECPIFVDGQRVGTASDVSWSEKTPIEFSRQRETGIEAHGPPKYEVEATLNSQTDLQFEYDSTVEIAIPPSEHDASGWMVIELSEIHRFEIDTDSHLSLAAYDGRIERGVEYLGFDTKRAVDDEKLVESKPGVSIRVDTKSDVSDDVEFSADIQDI